MNFIITFESSKETRMHEVKGGKDECQGTKAETVGLACLESTS